MIYYSHVNEDNFAERAIIKNKSIDCLFAIAGSGERVIALMDHPTIKDIHIIDNNKEALYLTELKITAIQFLSPEEYLSFIGFSNCNKTRFSIFNKIKDNLSQDCSTYWSIRKYEINHGILNCGHFELFLNTIRPLIKLILGKQFYKLLDKEKNQLESFPTCRWRIVKYLFSLKFIYKFFGMKDEAFISSNANPSYIPQALDKSINENRVKTSCLFHLVFNGNLSHMENDLLPSSFQINVITRIKNKLKTNECNIVYQYGDALEVLTKYKLTSRQNIFFSLSDLLSFVDLQYMTQLLSVINKYNHDLCIIALRSFIKNRITLSELKTSFQNIKYAEDISHHERTNLYQVFKIDF